MNARLYIGLVSISFGATVWGMHTHTPDQEALFAIKRSKPMVAPIYIERNFGSPTPYSHSAPVLSHVPQSPSTHTRSTSALGKNKSPKNKSPRNASTGSIDKESALLVAREEDRVKQIAALKAAAEKLKKSLDDYSTAVAQIALPSTNQPENPEEKS